MTLPEKTFNEASRLQDLRDLQLLDTTAEPVFDNLAQFASEICETPVALISLIDRDRVWFKSRVGFDDSQAPREQFFCSHVIEADTPLIVQDATADSRFQYNELVLAPQGIRFYAGIPLVLSSGSAVGTLCVIDHRVRTLSDKQLKSLNRLAILVIAFIEARRTHMRLLAQEQKTTFSEQRLDFALNSAEIGEWERDLLTGVTRRSLTHDRIFGYSEAVPEWSYEIFLSHVVEADRARVDAAYRRARDGAGTVENEYRIVWPDGSTHWLWTLGRFYFDADGKLYRAAGIVIDVTERKQSEARLLESEIRHRSMFENNPQPMWLLDAETLAFLSVNDAAVARYGYSREEFSRMTIRDIRPAEELTRLEARLTKDIHTRSTNSEVWTHQCKNGSKIQVEINSHAMDFQGRPAVLILANDVTEQLKSQAKVQRLAYHDSLTGLPNRAHFLEVANQALHGSTSGGNLSACILFDLDNFKRINDNWGHRVGDELLKQVALRVQQSIPSAAFLARLGGDEFILLIVDAGRDQAAASFAAQDLCRKIIVTLEQGFTIDQREHFTSASLGVALFGGAEMKIDELLSRADSAMYSAKAEGRNTFRFFDGQLQAQLAAQSELEGQLRQCIQNNELHLAYQPQVDAQGRIVGSEALLRWTHPQRGPVSPAQFIPAAETSGLILQIGRWVLHNACLALAKWQSEAAMAGLTVAVNVSAKQFHHPDFVSQVLSELELSGANPALLKLELTESLLAQDLDGIVQKMNALKVKGVSFSLDDFGTGYSSLAYLKRLPLNQLKIDQGFVRDILLDASDAAIVRTVIALGDLLGLNVIAEGVETHAQMEFLESNGCYFYQGYLFGRPMKQEDFEAFCSRA